MAVVPQQNVINEERHMTSLLRLTRPKPHGMIRFMHETLKFKKTDIFFLVMTQFLCTTATLALEVPTMSVSPTLPFASPPSPLL